MKKNRVIFIKGWGHTDTLDHIEEQLKKSDNVNWKGEWAAEYGDSLVDAVRKLSSGMDDLIEEKNALKDVVEQSMQTLKDTRRALYKFFFTIIFLSIIIMVCILLMIFHLYKE